MTCSHNNCNEPCKEITALETSALKMIEQAYDLRQLFGYPVDSGAACDHTHHKEALREAFNHYTEANEQYELPGIIEYLTLCTLILCSYKADAGDAIQLDFTGMMTDFNAAAVVFDIDLKRAFNALTESEQSKLVTCNQLDETRKSYAILGIATDFNHRRDSRFLCHNKATGQPLPGISYQEPDWQDTAQWSRLRNQAA